MKKILLLFTLLLTIGLIGCNDVNNGQSNEDSNIRKLELSDELKAKLDENSDNNIYHICEEYFVYSTFNNPNTIVTVSTAESNFDFNIGRNIIETFLGYDIENNLLYWGDSNNSFHVEGGTSDFDVDLPILYKSTSFYYTADNVYDYHGNCITNFDYEDTFMNFKDTDLGDFIYYMYDSSESVVKGYNMTDSKSLGRLSLKDNYEFEKFEFGFENNIIFRTKFGEAFVSVDREKTIKYFIKDEHTPSGYNSAVGTDIYLHRYPFFTYEDSNYNEIYVVADPTFSNFIELEEIDDLIYLDQDYYVMRDKSNSKMLSLYNGDKKIYDYISPMHLVHTVLRYNNYIIFIDYETGITVVDAVNSEVKEVIDGRLCLYNDNYYSVINDNNELVIYNLDDFTSEMIKLSLYGENTLVGFLDNNNFSIINDDVIDIYNYDSLEKTEYELVDKFTYLNKHLFSLGYGYLVTDGVDYFIIG